MKKTKIKNSIQKYWFIYLILLPGIVIVLVYNYFPLIMQAVMSLQDYKLSEGLFGSKWNAFDNYRNLFQSIPNLDRIIQNTLEISFWRFVFDFFPPLLLAIFLFELKSNLFRRVSQTIVYIPYFFSWVIIYGISYGLFSYEGLVSSLAVLFGGEKSNYLMRAECIRPILFVTSVWKNIGWGTIIYLAAMQGINPELFEAAKMDGCPPVKRIWYIIVPGIQNVTIFLFMMGIGNLLRNVNSEQILLFYSPATYSKADVIDTWLYRVGLKQPTLYGMSAALSFVQSTLGLIMILSVNQIIRKWKGVALW